MAERQTLRILAGAEPRQPYHRWQGQELKDQAQRQPGLHRSDSALGAFLRRKKPHLGTPKAITATAHKLARLIYSMLRHGQEYVDAGAEYYESQYQHRALRAAKRRASQLGYQLVPMSDATGVPLNPPAAVA